MNNKEFYDAELNYIKGFIQPDLLYSETGREQLRALWVAFCLHNGLEVDTGAYDSILMEIWGLVKVYDSPFNHVDWHNFDTFDLYMGLYLA